nr:peroxidase 27 [Quercus suber]
MFVPFVLDLANAQRLKVGFYAKTCPQAEIIVKKGCDGSVLLNSSTNQTEKKNAFPNLSLRGFQIIDIAKSALEKARPGVVSCADILALVASDVIATIKGPSWEVESGRRDGRISNITEALLNLVPPNANISTLKKEFQQRGLSVKELVVLSGGHTIGISHCSSFNIRLYNFTGKGDTDPTLDPNYIIRLKGKCKPGDLNTIVEMDPGSFKTFDEDYHTLVAKRRGLFQSDAALLDDTEAKAYVKLQATTHGSTFFEDAVYQW